MVLLNVALAVGVIILDIAYKKGVGSKGLKLKEPTG